MLTDVSLRAEIVKNHKFLIFFKKILNPLMSKIQKWLDKF